MDVITNIGTLIFGLFNFGILWLLIYNSFGKDWRDSFISAALCFGVFIWGLAELLNSLNHLTFSGILSGCIIYDICILSSLLYKHKRGLLSFPKISISQLKHWEFYFIGGVLIITFFLALAYPPNNWDSMTYHLPRIEHWIQNGNLDHYYTSIPKQLFFAPFAEITILYGRILSGNDWLMNLVQWFAFGGTIICVSKIVAHLDLNEKMQRVAAVFFATLPMAILQASSTQNDLVETFWLVCLAERLLAWNKEGGVRYSLEFGLALGLAILTKGTAYPIAFPLVLFFAIKSVFHYKKHLVWALCAGMLCLALNMPHYIRNYNYFGNPIETQSTTVSPFTIKSFFISSFSNIYSNIPAPLPKSLEINEELSSLGKEIYPYGSLKISSLKKWKETSWSNLIKFHEDLAANTIHSLFLIASIIFLLFNKKTKKKYTLIILASWAMFFFCIPWQPWITRLQTPLFALSAPLFALALSSTRHIKSMKWLIVLPCALAIFPLFWSETHPILISDKKKFWNTDRDELIFIHNPSLYKDYKNAAAAITEANLTNIGIIIGDDTWEYPLWKYLNGDEIRVKISHQKPDSIQQDIDGLFIFTPDNMTNDETKIGIPSVYIRDAISAKWNMIYPLNIIKTE